MQAEQRACEYVVWSAVYVDSIARLQTQTGVSPKGRVLDNWQLCITTADVSMMVVEILGIAAQ